MALLSQKKNVANNASETTSPNQAGGGSEYRITEVLTLADTEALEEEISHALESETHSIRITFVEAQDPRIPPLIGWIVTHAFKSQPAVTVTFTDKKNAESFQAHVERERAESSNHADRGIFEQIGRQVCDFCSELRSVLNFMHVTATYLLSAVAKPHLFRGKELVTQIDQAGYGALSITILINGLIGIVITYLMGNQLSYYGANIFVVDGIGITMCRELSPLLVSIIVAGRSGSAFAAQIGSMRLNKEIEALEVMGLSPYAILVLPRILALVLCMPLLVAIGDMSGIIGGAGIAYAYLDVHPVNFFDRLNQVLLGKHIAVGIFKAPLYALCIASIGCRFGLFSEPNSASIGRNTTRTVVHSIIAVIILNAAIAVILTHLGI